MSNLLSGLRAGARTFRYWRAQQQRQRESGSPVDRNVLLATARDMQAGLDEILNVLHRDGVAIIENYWTAERCEAARREIDQLMGANPNCVRRFSGDADKRLFGVETAGENCNAFHHDILLRSIGEIEGGHALYNLATLGARIDATSTNRGSGDGWHRDSFGYQFKAIIYLSDVTDENGPFEYIVGSQKAWRAGIDSALGRYPAPPESRIARERIEELVSQGMIVPRRFTGKAGTVILANTTGIHSGAPLKAGTRYALTNYYYFPYQIGKSIVEKFEPLPPGVMDRLAPFLASEED